MILKNSIICTHCSDEIVSEHRHDFKYCTCFTCSVDGGRDYLRRGFKNPSDYKETSVTTDSPHSEKRKVVKWGNNYDKDMNRLPKTIYNPIMNMTSDHITAILEGGWAKNNPFYEELFKEELKFRIKESV